MPTVYPFRFSNLTRLGCGLVGSKLGLLPTPAHKLLRDEAVGPLLGGLPVEFPGVALAKLTLHQLQHLLFELLAAQVPAPPQRLERFLVDGLQPAPFHLPLELLTPRCGVLPNAVLAQQAVHAHGARHEPNHVWPPPASQTPKTASPPLPPLSGRFTRTNLRLTLFRYRARHADYRGAESAACLEVRRRCFLFLLHILDRKSVV